MNKSELKNPQHSIGSMYYVVYEGVSLVDACIALVEVNFFM